MNDMYDNASAWHEDLCFLNELLPSINSARSRENPVEECEYLCKAVNKTFNRFYEHQRSQQVPEVEEKKHSDSGAFETLLCSGINASAGTAFCRSASLKALVELTPQIMDHGKLLRRHYDPRNIEERIRKEASEAHRDLRNAFDRFGAQPEDPGLQKTLLKRTANLIYMVRSNIAHSEKTPHGPDLDKVERDRAVSAVTSAVVNDLLELVLDHPEHRLAVYGTLVPGGANESRLKAILGIWADGLVCGQMSERDGFAEFSWSFRGQEHPSLPVKVLTSASLGQHLPELDRFEGPRYKRILVPVAIDDRTLACNIYQAAE